MKIDLEGKIVIVSGGAGLLGMQFCHAIKEINGFPIILDIKVPEYPSTFYHLKCDITSEKQVHAASQYVNTLFLSNETEPALVQTWNHQTTKICGLINCAAIDPKFDASEVKQPNIEDYPLDQWKKEIDVGLTGAFLCTKYFGKMMFGAGGSIINISSLLGIVAPNQNMYKILDKVKPVCYTTIKHAIVGLTKHTATEWAKHGIRCNALAPNGIFNNHPKEFVELLTKYIPLGRMAEKDEYNSAIQFLLSDASKYMTGQTLVIDGGHSSW